MLMIDVNIFADGSQVTMFFRHDSFTLIEDILVQASDVFVQAGNPKFVCSSLQEGITDKHHLLELEAFDNTKAGVRGLVEDGVTKVPRMFIIPRDWIDEKIASNESDHFKITVIDLGGADMENMDSVKHKEIASQVGRAAETDISMEYSKHVMKNEPQALWTKIIRTRFGMNVNNWDSGSASSALEKMTGNLFVVDDSTLTMFLGWIDAAKMQRGAQETNDREETRGEGEQRDEAEPQRRAREET
ncbi:hypothetical protein Sjap_000618 [Stephania japonica]|uniref:Uncharacterized protein n=1 Tax=Stephania japonica TaxID=461633 RepID=A0AAP0KK04_9MAGN